MSETAHASTCLPTERDEPLHRRRRQTRQRRRLVRPGIPPAILGVVTVTMITLRKFSAIEQPPDPRLHGGQHLGHVLSKMGKTKSNIEFPGSMANGGR